MGGDPLHKIADQASPKLPDFLSLLTQPVQFLALGLGSGLAPKAPGTWGSVAAVLIYLIALQWLTLELQLAVLVLGFVVGIYFCEAGAEALGVHDHGAIVWDEFIGQWMVLVFVCAYWNATGFVAIALAFVLFRVFDISKPWPIRWADGAVHGGFGIMLDDVLAAVMAIFLLAMLNAMNGLAWMF